MDYKKIHIGKHIKYVAEFKNLSISRACVFLKCSHQDILEMYTKESIECNLLVKWCKLLDYNFFMFYHSHLQLYKPSAAIAKLSSIEKQQPEIRNYIFKKNLYMPEIIDWIIEKFNSNELTIKEIIEDYNIPRTTIYRWIKKANQNIDGRR